MKNHQELLKLQAYLDGELPESEARGLVDWLAADPEAAALLAELDSTRGALREFDEQIKLPESRDFYWSKIQRAISREVPAGEPIQDLPVWFAKMRRFLMTTKGLSEDEAISLMSVAVDFGVTQVVDANWGIHAILKKAIFTDAD